MKPAIETFCPSSRQHWREWLAAHYATAQAVWLVYYKKHTRQPSLTWSEAVDEALCFGWIDSRALPLDADRYQQFFSCRKPGSTWSRVNKQKLERLEAAGLLAPAGRASIELAKQNGSWIILDDVEELRVPADLAAALAAQPAAAAYFAGLGRTATRNLLQWLVLARRPETRHNRIAEIAESAAQGVLPKQFRRPPKVA